MTAIMVDERGVRPCASVEDVKKAVESGHVFWLDIVGESEETGTSLMKAAGLEAADIVTLLRFRQTGRMRLATDKVRVVTWIAHGEGLLVEVHLAGCGKSLITVWSGDPAMLEPIRRQFSKCVAGIEGDMHYGAGLLLQFLIGTLDASLEAVDAHIDTLRLSLDQHSSSKDYSLIRGA